MHRDVACKKVQEHAARNLLDENMVLRKKPDLHPQIDSPTAGAVEASN